MITAEQIDDAQLAAPAAQQPAEQGAAADQQQLPDGRGREGADGEEHDRGPVDRPSPALRPSTTAAKVITVAGLTAVMADQRRRRAAG